MARSGRRPGRADTRGEIVAAARQWFAAKGYSGATIRGIAASAGVDPALIHHYFGTKRDLFLASLQLPFDPAEVVATATSGDPEQAGERLLRLLLEAWGGPQGERMQSLLRSAFVDEEMMVALRGYVVQTVLTPITEELAPDRKQMRASLLASQVMGLAMVRHIAKLEPLATADHDTVVAAVAPALQRYLTGDF